MNILVACEESQRVCMAFREKGHRAFSCDVIECSGGHPEWHIMQDVIPLLNGDCEFRTQNGMNHIQQGKWDMIIAFPPCTYLCVTGNRWFDVVRYGDKAKQRYVDRYKAIVFFMQFALADCEKIVIENPVGIMSTAYRKPNQIIQPYYFGHTVSKKTCLWIKGLPKLKPTDIVAYEKKHSKGKTGGYSGASWCAINEETGKSLSWSDPETAKIRSKTFLGIAKAMAEQWG